MRTVAQSRADKPCPNCGKMLHGPALGGHKSHCGAVQAPGSIWAKRKPTKRTGTVYLLETEEGPHRVKIGFTAGKVGPRARSLENASPVRIRVRAHWPGTTVDEWHLHHRFRESWSHGEWFAGDIASQVEEHMGAKGAA